MVIRKGKKGMYARNAFRLPPRIFLYTVDQVASLTQMTEKQQEVMLFFEDLSDPAFWNNKRIRVVNISPPGTEPIWRVQEQELLRWARAVKLRVYNLVDTFISMGGLQDAPPQLAEFDEYDADEDSEE